MSLSSVHGSASASPVEISAELRLLAARYREQPTPLGDLLDALGPRASALLVIICALPFSTPLSIPGLSTPFGLVILLLATRYFLGLPPWLPRRLRRVVLPALALVAVVMTFSALKRDGAGIFAGYALFAFTVGYFVFWGAVVVESFDRYGAKLLSPLG